MADFVVKRGKLRKRAYWGALGPWESCETREKIHWNLLHTLTERAEDLSRLDPRMDNSSPWSERL